MSFVESHDAQVLGVLRCGESDADQLASLTDIVRWLQLEREVPLLLAIEQLADAIERGLCGQVFRCDPLLYARQLEADDVVIEGWWAFEYDGPTRGLLAVAASVRRWAETRWLRSNKVPDLTIGPAIGLAIRRSIAQEVFGYMQPACAVAVQLVAVPVDARRVEPKGASWPHQAGTRWSDEEKTAMRAMRVAGMSDVEIAAVAGCKRQVVGQQIGSQTAARTSVGTMARALAAA